MAFIKRTNFAFEDNNKETNVVDGKVSIPLVITKESGKYHGFVPGIVMKDVIEQNITDCETILKDHVRKYVLKVREDKVAYPFFPSNEEIKQDFKNVVLIKRLSVKA